MYSFSKNPENIFEDFAYRIYLDNLHYLKTGNYELKNFFEVISEKANSHREKIKLVEKYIDIFYSALSMSELDEDERKYFENAYKSLRKDTRSFLKLEKSYISFNRSLDAMIKMFEESIREVNQRLYFLIDFSIKHFTHYADLEMFIKARNEEIMRLFEDNLQRKNKKTLGSLTAAIKEIIYLKNELLPKYNLDTFWFEEKTLQKYELSLEYVSTRIDKIRLPQKKLKKLNDKFGRSAMNLFESIVEGIITRFKDYLFTYNFWLRYYKESFKPEIDQK